MSKTSDQYGQAQTGGGGGEPIVVRAYKSSSQSITSGTSATKVTFVEDIDNTDSFDNSTFTATTAGYYKVNLFCTATGVTVDQSVWFMPYKNGSSIGIQHGSIVSSTSSSKNVYAMELVYLDVGDTFEWYVAGVDTNYSLTTWTYMHITKVN